MKQAERILFIRTDRIGDTLMNLPAVHLLRETFPKAWIAFLAEKGVAELLEGHPDLDEVMRVDSKRFKKERNYRFGLLREIKKARFDLAVVSNPDRRLHLLVFLAGIRRRVGYGRKWGFLLNEKMKKISGITHEAEKNLALARLAAGRGGDRTFVLPVGDLAEKQAAEMLEKDFQGKAKIVALHPGTTNPAKRWPWERFAELCDLLEASGVRVLLIGGAEETKTSRSIAGRARREPVDWTGRLSLKQLAALFSSGRVSALVSADSGPVHVAWMSGTPVVALYARNVDGSDPARWGPLDRKSRVIHKPMIEISSREVVELARELLG